jgi:hypothetical protein
MIKGWLVEGGGAPEPVAVFGVVLKGTGSGPLPAAVLPRVGQPPCPLGRPCHVPTPFPPLPPLADTPASTTPPRGLPFLPLPPHLPHPPSESSSGGMCVTVPYVLVWMRPLFSAANTRLNPKSGGCGVGAAS